MHRDNTNSRQQKSNKNQILEKVLVQTNLARKAIDAVVCPACGVSGHHIDITGCDKMAQFNLLEEYNNSKNISRIQKATNIYTKYQKERHRKCNFDKE